jgi:hypothetical protein
VQPHALHALPHHATCSLDAQPVRPATRLQTRLRLRWTTRCAAATTETAAWDPDNILPPPPPEGHFARRERERALQRAARQQASGWHIALVLCCSLPLRDCSRMLNTGCSALSEQGICTAYQCTVEVCSTVARCQHC